MGTYPPPSPTQTLRQGVGIRGAVPLCRGEVIGLPLRYSLHVAHVLFLAFVCCLSGASTFGGHYIFHLAHKRPEFKNLWMAPQRMFPHPLYPVARVNH